MASNTLKAVVELAFEKSTGISSTDCIATEEASTYQLAEHVTPRQRSVLGREYNGVVPQTTIMDPLATLDLVTFASGMQTASVGGDTAMNATLDALAARWGSPSSRAEINRRVIQWVALIDAEDAP